jgi:hypothetical protein
MAAAHGDGHSGRINIERERAEREAREELKKAKREAYDMDFLSHLSFQPAAQRWARDRVQKEEEGEWRHEAHPNLVSYVIVLRRAEDFAPSERRAVAALQDALLQQFVNSGLLVCEQDDPNRERDLFIGVYASLDALLDEKRNVMSENLLSWTGSDIAELPAVTRVNPSETMLLTRRIIDRAIDFIRVRYDGRDPGSCRGACAVALVVGTYEQLRTLTHTPPSCVPAYLHALAIITIVVCFSRGENNGFTGKPAMMDRLCITLKNKCGKNKLGAVTVQLLIRDLFGLHCKHVRTNLLRLFAEETRLFCCRSFRK